AYQRPSGSREMVTVVGLSVVGSTSGQDHTYSSGASIFASHNRPSRQRNALRGEVADWRPRRDVNRGERARPAKRFTDAVHWGRSVCWSGTEDTSDRNANSGSRLSSVRYRSVSAYDVLIPSAW